MAKTLFVVMDVLYGRQATLEKFVVLELVARVPYQVGEQAAYLAITRHAAETHLARRIHDRVCRTREQQDNEQWHLFILEDILEHDGAHLGWWFRYRFLPQVMAFVYRVRAGQPPRGAPLVDGPAGPDAVIAVIVTRFVLAGGLVNRPTAHATDATGGDVDDATGGWVVHGREPHAPADVDLGQPLEQLGRPALRQAGSPTRVPVPPHRRRSAP